MNMSIPKCDISTVERETQQSTVGGAGELALDEIISDYNPLETPNAYCSKQHERQ
jgi:hypothetical protein